MVDRARGSVVRGRMSYVVLARKWRPTQFDEVVGQGHVARTLKNAIEQDRVAHAFLFAGARGVGKTSTARILAKALNCKKGPTPTPCDECVACIEIAKGQAVDVFEIDGASNRGINEIRDLRESVRYAPSRDAYKIYIIDEVHMLTTEAFNALLKTLEEPPPHAKFIFATTEPQKIPVTILSRCQRYDFKRVGQQDIVEHLENICRSEKIDAERGALQLVARQAAGGMRDALSLLDQIISFSDERITEAQVGEVLGVANRRQLFELSEAVVAADAERALRILDDVNRYGYDLVQFAGELVAHFRDLTVIKVVESPSDVTDLTDSEIEIARKQIENAPANLLHRYFSAMAEATQELARSSFPKLVFEMTLVRLTQLEPLVGVDLLVDRLRALEGMLDDAPPERSKNPKVPQPEPAPEAPPPNAEERESPRSEEREVRVSPSQGEPELSEGGGALRAGSPRSEEREVRAVGASRPEGSEGPGERWRGVVAQLHESNRPLAMACEHGVPNKFDDGVVEVAFPESYVDLVREPERLDALQSTIERRYPGPWRVLVKTLDEPATVQKTLAQEREDEVERRRRLVEDELRNHAVVREAQSLFDVDPASVRVQVKLFDED